MRSACVVLALLVAGCATETVNLKNPSTGATAACGPYRTSGVSAAARLNTERSCVEDYERQGYERVPEGK